jgi:hypothetical protein
MADPAFAEVLVPQRFLERFANLAVEIARLTLKANFRSGKPVAHAHRRQRSTAVALHPKAFAVPHSSRAPSAFQGLKFSPATVSH